MEIDKHINPVQKTRLAGFFVSRFQFFGIILFPVPTGPEHERSAQSFMHFPHIVTGEIAVNALMDVDISDKLGESKLIVIQSFTDHHHVFPPLGYTLARE